MKDLCSIELLRNAVSRGLSADEEAALHVHLEHCELCCAQIEQLAGGEAWQQEAASLLTADELDEAVSVAAAWSEEDFSVGYLDPSDDANVLGRLGGYDVRAIVGRGGMGIVLKAFDRELKRLVAIKVLAPHLAHSSVARKRFAREAQGAAAVVNPHVIAIHHVQPTGRLPFLIMPLLTGESLAQRLKARGPLDLTEVLRIGMQAAAGLAAAHDQGLVHRDVKPANIFLEKGIERVVITDFGLARAADDVSMTRLGVVAGTPEYMSPEQARGEALDGRSDLFSLGCVLYEMATGVSPFRGDSTMATLRRIVDEKPAAMASLGPELPPWFNGIVERLLSKDPAQRFASASEVSDLLERCLSHLQQPTSVPLPSSLVPQATGRPSIFSLPRKGLVAMLGTIGFSLLGMFLWQSSEPPDIAGQWSGEEWGQVVLKKTSDAEYAGNYSDTFGKQPGEIQLKWSRLERRFNGTWREGGDRRGQLSVRLVGDEIRGAWTTNKKSKESGTPRLADLVWTQSTQTAPEETPPRFGPVIQRTIHDLDGSRTNPSMIDLDSGKLISASAAQDQKIEALPSFAAVERALKWMRTEGIDLFGDTSGRTFNGLDMLLVAAEEEFDQVTEQQIATDGRLDGPVQKQVEVTVPVQFFRASAARPSPLLPGVLTTEVPPTYVFKTRDGNRGVLQVLGFSDGLESMHFRYKLVTPLRKQAAAQINSSKRQRFEPVEGQPEKTSWAVFAPPSLFSKTDWVVMARMTIGGEARIRLTEDKQPRCVIKLLKGSDEAITVQVQDAAKKSKTIVSIARDQSAEVTVDGAGYNIRYPSVEVALEDADSSPFAQVIVRRVDNEPSAPAKGLEFLAPYPQLHGLSLGMTEKEFHTIVESQKLKVHKTTADGKTTYSITMGDGHTVIVMFGNDSDKCRGIQRL
ncbi:MAG TPA: serine/threonine-protein kinase [Pirellulaceae bacterium]|nr:serine/threonine-protein kinase [Pirellulaceae bacterium]